MSKCVALNWRRHGLDALANMDRDNAVDRFRAKAYSDARRWLVSIDLVTMRTEDKVTLAGAMFTPANRVTGKAVDAVLLSPGTSGTFYNDMLVEIATGLNAAGYPAMTLSTRGHDIVFRDPASQRFLGAAFERISECTFDFTAAIRCLVDRGYERIANFGHSLGGNKVLYYAAHDPHPNLAATISSAGPRWSKQMYSTSQWGDAYREHEGRAKAMVAEGRGGDLMPMTFPIGPSFMTADGWLEKYGAERYNMATWADQIRTPVLRLDAELDTGTIKLAMANVAEDIQRLAPNPRHRAVVIPGADHFYTGVRGAVVREVVSWLDGLPV